MCDHTLTIMNIVRKVKEIEKSLKRELSRAEYELIFEAMNKEQNMLIDGKIFSYK